MGLICQRIRNDNHSYYHDDCFKSIEITLVKRRRLCQARAAIPAVIDGVLCSRDTCSWAIAGKVSDRE